jgi:hypothetical protein
MEGRLIDQAGTKDFGPICDDRYADSLGNGAGPSSLGSQNDWQSSPAFLLAGLQGNKGRALSGCLGDCLQTAGAGWIRYLEPKRAWVGTPSRWLWLQKTEPNRPWSALPIQVPENVRALFSVAMQTELGDGKSTLFWSDRWLHGQKITDIAPRLVAAVPRKRINKRTVYEALMTSRWISDIQGALTVGIIAEFLHLWDVLLTVQLQPDISDNHFWRLAAQGKYSAKAAYENFLLGAAGFAPYQKIWKTWAPAKCRFFLWLVAHKKCWTADRLACHGMDHPDKCPMCDQEEETIVLEYVV